MSRRRKMKPAPKRMKDLQQKRLRFVCTNMGAHDVEYVTEWVRSVSPGRPDLGRMRPAGDIGTRCRKCNRQPPSLDGDALWTLLETAEPGRVLRYDISTGRPVNGPGVA